MAFLLSVALGIVAVVASLVLWCVLDLTGIFDRVNTLLSDIGGAAGASLDVRKVASLQQVVSFTTILSLVNIVLLTALSMLAAVLYNICASMVGGLGVTLTDD
jgi:thiosulfate reductase cytochrome b subunit